MADSLSIDFTNGLGTLGNAFNVDTSVHGQVTLSGSSALMEWAAGAASGHGYGTYDISAKINGNQPGPGIIFWPGDNQWPGQEIDLVEVTPDGSGRQYGTLHWNDGGDSYSAQVYNGVSSGQFHDYQMVWEPGKITMKVDGSVMGVFTDHVPVDYAHGGMNDTIGFLNTNGNTSITVSHVSYTPLDGGAPASNVTPAATAAVAAATSTATDAAHTDWASVAQQVEANYEATGHWFL